jgi:hypothetical protein
MRQGTDGLYLRPWILPVFFTVLRIHAPACAEDPANTAGGGAARDTVTKGIVILTAFPDVSHDVDRGMVQMRFSRQLNGYVREMSYGKVSLDIDVTEKWYTLPNPVRQYRISPRNLEVDKSRVRRLIDDALNAADPDVDFSKYSFAVIFMGAALTDYGMIGLCGYPGMLGWGSEDVLTTRSGERIPGVAIFCYQAHLGTLFHDIAHILGGVKDGRRMVPCLYDHDLQSKPGPIRETAIDAMVNMGFWDPMSCHYYKRGVAPPGISSWTKMRLNWIDPAKVRLIRPGENAEVLLGPLEDGSSQTLVIKIPVSQTAYYLIENRQPIGCDRFLPGQGVLILYADDRIAECRQGRAPVKLMDADPSKLHLEGAAFDIGAKTSFQDGPNRLSIQLVEKVENSYKIRISR